MTVETEIPVQNNPAGALDAIRAVETESARRIVQAEQRARLAEENARQEAEMHLASASARAKENAERYLQEVREKAELESEAILQQAEHLVRQINQTGERQTAAAAKLALALLTGRLMESAEQ